MLKLLNGCGDLFFDFLLMCSKIILWLKLESCKALFGDKNDAITKQLAKF